MKTKNNDFAEIDFIGKVKETGEVFDTSIEEEAKKANLLQEKEGEKFKPLTVCVGQGMVVKGFDNALNDKETGKEYEIELNPEDAFGKRDSKLVKVMPLAAFRQRGIEPAAGMMLALDSFLVKISSVTSGRVIADFNNPLSGKHIIYKFKINKIIDENKEKISILSRFFIGIEPKAIIDEGKTIIEFEIKLPPKIEEEFKKKIKEILGIEVEIRESKEEKKTAERMEAERPYNE